MQFRSMVISGFALFAMFFGAGNLLFPPYLGMRSGLSWALACFCFVLIEVVMSCAGIYALISAGGSIPAMRRALGKWPGLLLNAIAVTCTGILIAPPRTAATTYEISVLPFTDAIPLWAFSAAFFLLSFALTVRPTRLVDIVGRFLTPLLTLGVVLLIAAGVAVPIGTMAPPCSPRLVEESIIAGYQTLDVICAVGFALVLQKNFVQIGFRTQALQLRATLVTVTVAGIILAIIYAGLMYIGATCSNMGWQDQTQAGILVLITRALLGDFGVLVLGIVTGLACLTTCIGVVGSASAYFAELADGRFTYGQLCTAFMLIAFALCNLGLTAIIQIAAPILTAIVPPFIAVSVVMLFAPHTKNQNIYRGAALGAFLAGLVLTVHEYINLHPMLESVPFYFYGFGWALPAVIGAFIGKLFPCMAEEVPCEAS